jgi:hypothetical protein
MIPGFRREEAKMRERRPRPKLNAAKVTRIVELCSKIILLVDLIRRSF